MATYYAKEYKATYSSTMTNPNEVHGGPEFRSNICKVHGSIGTETWIYRSFLWYDLSGIPYKSKITSAKLWLFCSEWNDDAADSLHNFSRVTETWDEETLTWNNMPAVDSQLYLDEWAGPPDVETWGSYDITAMVQEWVDQVYPNYGLQIVNQAEEDIWRLDWFFYNRHYDLGSHSTYLEIEYEPEDEYKISAARMTEIAEQVRRITGSTNPLTANKIVEALTTLPASSN